MSTMKEEFSNYSPCIYEKNISCSDCENYKKCDMRMGRELHEQCFIAGWNKGSDILRVQTNDKCEINTYSSRVCKYGTKSCVLTHE